MQGLWARSLDCTGADTGACQLFGPCTRAGVTYARAHTHKHTHMHIYIYTYADRHAHTRANADSDIDTDSMPCQFFRPCAIASMSYLLLCYGPS